MNSLEFHGADYAIPQFVEEFSQELPVIATVTSGSSGCGYEISADEVYWIYGFQRQRRLVVKESSEKTGSQTAVKFLSIPTDYPAKFHSIKDKRSKKNGPAMPLEKVLEEVKCNPAPHLIMFENNADVSFTIGGQKDMTASFGVMEIVDVYSQKYLAGYSITDSSIYPVNTAVPVFMDITLDVGCGIKKRSRATFHQWINDISEMIESSFQTREAPMYYEIVQFNEVPDGGHYEYMRPKKYFVRNEDLNSKRNYTPLQMRQTSDYGPPPSSSSIYSTGDKLPDLPKRSHVLLPPRPCHAPVKNSTREPRKLRLPPVRPRSPFRICDVKNASEVPASLDFESLTVEDVAHCLCLLGMWRHAVTLQEREVDGAMLLRLDERTLVEDFSFTKFDAAQFVKFRSGWRPKSL